MQTNKTYDKWLKRVKDRRTPWTENDIIYFRRAVGSSSHMPTQLKQELVRRFQETAPYRITAAQTAKGLDFLRRKAFRIDGKPRQTADFPFSNYELTIIKTASHFQFVGLANSAYLYGGGYTWYLPIYRLYSKSGDYFDYIGCRDLHVIDPT